MIIIYRYNVSLDIIPTKFLVICRTRCYCCSNLPSRCSIESKVNSL
nr:MAG TPA_asm: hypothetical protein [Caudoviricetes sp.]